MYRRKRMIDLRDTRDDELVYKNLLSNAIRDGNEDAIHTLLMPDKGDDFSRLCGYHEAVGLGKVKITDVFLQHGVDIDEPDPVFFESALMHSVRHNHMDMVQFLLNKGASINFKSHDSTTCLHVAVLRPGGGQNAFELLSQLVKIPGIKLDEYSDDGKTPLMAATRHSHTTAMKILVEAGANVNLKTADNKSLAHLCLDTFNPFEIMRSSDCLSLVIHRGLDPDVTFQNVTPIFEAIRKNNIHAVRVLIKANCDIDFIVHTSTLQNEDDKPVPPHPDFCKCNYTPFHCAFDFNNERICKLLVECGCNYYKNHTLAEEKASDKVYAGLCKWFSSICCRPKSLNDICRSVIRSAIGHFPRTKVETLNVPSSIKEYLLLDDIMGRFYPE